jgi:hypothetical protein
MKRGLDWSNDDEPKSNVVVSEVKPGFTAPKPFSGYGNSVDAIAEEYLSWKVQLNNYVKGLTIVGGRMSPEVELYRRLACLCGQAVLIAQDVIETANKEEDGSARWADVEARLDELFLGAVNPQSVIATLNAIKQTAGQSVSDYAARWNAVHRRLMSMGVSNRDIAAQWFVQGLLPSVKARVTEKLLEDQPLMKYAVKDAAGAVTCVTGLALAREQAMQTRRSDTSLSSGWSRESRSWRFKPTSGEREPSLTARVNSMATDFATILGISDATVQQRLKAKECLSCGSRAHRMRECPKVRQARVNSLVSEQEYSKDESKNE